MVQNNPPRSVSLLIVPKRQVIFAVLALCIILVLGTSIFYLLPYDGALIDFNTREIIQLDKGGPAERAGALLGDQILAINGHTVDRWGRSPSYPPGIKMGEILTYELQRGVQTFFLSIPEDSLWQHPSLLWVLIGLLFLSIIFWTVGILICLFVPGDDIRARLIGLLWLVAGVAIAAGGPGSATNFWGARTLFKVALCSLAFVGVTAHLYFPVTAFTTTNRKRIINSLAVASILMSLASILDDIVLKPALSSFTGFYIILYAYLLIAMLAIIGLLFRSRFWISELNTRRQANLVFGGTLLGLAPFIIFTLLPIILFGNGHEYIDGTLSVLFLIFLPITYAYVIYQRKLLRLDFLINRLVVFFVLSLIVLLVSFTTLGIIAFIFHLPTQMPLFGGMMATFMVLPASAIQNRVQIKVNQFLYGKHYDHTIVTSDLSNRLSQTLDRAALTSLLNQGLAQQMGIKQTAFLLADGDHLIQQDGMDTFSIASNDEMCVFLLETRLPVRAQYLWGKLTDQTRTQWQHFLWGQLFTPIIYENQLLGILILGDRVASEVYSDMDVKIVEAVAHQAALAAANVQLVETLRGLTRQMVRSEEAQRKTVARELHDVVLQDLLFFKDTLVQKDPNLAAHLENTIAILRQTIKTQRPTLLNLGLPVALRGLTDDMNKLPGKKKPVIKWESEVETVKVSDEIAIYIYRIAHEAIINAIRHAKAERIQVSLGLKDGMLDLCVQDDGIGISTMQSFSEHFGLVGMRERAKMIGAQLNIASAPGKGTRVTLEAKL